MASRQNSEAGKRQHQQQALFSIHHVSVLTPALENRCREIDREKETEREKKKQSELTHNSSVVSVEGLMLWRKRENDETEPVKRGKIFKNSLNDTLTQQFWVRMQLKEN